MKETVFLTGASSGIGKELASCFAKEGYRLILVGRNIGALNKIKEEFPHCDIQILKLDLSDLSEVQSLSQETKEKVDILINCAGMSVTGKVEDIPITEVERCLRVNYLSPVSLIQQILPEMQMKKSGMIVNVSSGVALRALPYASPYCSAKAALNSFTDSLRVENEKFGLNFLLFSPGPVLTHFHDNIKHYGDTKLKSPPFNGKEANLIAQKFFKVILQKKKRVTLGYRAKVARELNHFFPELSDKLLGKIFHC